MPNVGIKGDNGRLTKAGLDVGIITTGVPGPGQREIVDISGRRVPHRTGKPRSGTFRHSV
jgi:hypothetical protein